MRTRPSVVISLALILPEIDGWVTFSSHQRYAYERAMGGVWGRRPVGAGQAFAVTSASTAAMTSLSALTSFLADSVSKTIFVCV